VNTKQLEHFLTVCRTGNISSASEELFLTRQALSKSIRALEQELNVRLLTRTSSGVDLTEAGSIIRDCAQQNLLMWEYAIERAMKTTAPHTIRLGAHLNHLTGEAIDFIMAYQDKMPGVKITLHDYEDYSQLFKLLRENKLDMVNARKHPEGEDLKWFKTMDCAVYLLANKENPLMKKSSVDFMRDLRGCLCFVFSRDTIAELSPYANEAGFVMEYMTPSYLALDVALSHNRGLFFAPSINVSVIVNDTIVARKIDKFPIETSNYFVYRVNTPTHITGFLEYLKGFSSLPMHQLNEDDLVCPVA
jgi:DNA-binding transcriptional LysR family regulator